MEVDVGWRAGGDERTLPQLPVGTSHSSIKIVQ
jgi:hypothetical protein